MKIGRIVVAFLLMLSVYAQADEKADVLNVCTHLGFQPFVIHDGNELSGIDVDTVKYLLHEIDQPYKLSLLPWARLIYALKNGSCDVGFSLFDREDRREYVKYVFAVPIHTSTFRVFVLKDSELLFEKVSDLFGLRVSYNRGFSLIHELNMGIESHSIARVEFDNPKSALNMLFAGRVDVILENELRIQYYLRRMGLEEGVKSLDVPFMPHEPAFLVLSKKSTKDINDLYRRFSALLPIMQKEGVVDKIVKKYLP
ncbi:transporter substrate-binding domain-containing protein [Terasakiella sp. A23]|uniref:substrate-binding periplasmic protein n=1 Tax=Terasakiella sp. FCG-A23 TaxID=3080561 RepID=UPI0029540654|nr:transporter substrate-binding domain-containing protein [Terasakiella sp. A23]MDV7341126.1 transporter substrate-binding domain-containing protein [Terasakiella sp. A23]